jgi:hypothetical protein
MKKMFFYPLLLFFVGGTILHSCRKGDIMKNGIPTRDSTGNSTGNSKSGPDVYLAVNERGAFYSQGITYSYQQGKYYKNNVPVTIPRCENLASITVSGNDVYAWAGRTNPFTYWKNGLEVAIPNFTPNHSTRIGALFVSGGDVYIPVTEFDYNGGTEEYTYSIATYRKNNTRVTLSDSSTINIATSITVSERGTYVTGFEVGNDSTRAKYWFNGSPVYLPGDVNDAAFAELIVVSGNDVYIGGEIGGRIVYWKNGNLVYVTDGTYRDLLTSMAVSGSDVYLAGNEYHQSKSIAMYWKNGTPVVVSPNSIQSYANGIAVDGNDVYVAGSEGINLKAIYWKNGIPAFISNSPNENESEAVSICLSK